VKSLVHLLHECPSTFTTRRHYVGDCWEILKSQCPSTCTKYCRYIIKIIITNWIPGCIVEGCRARPHYGHFFFGVDTFSKVNALVHLLCKVTIERTFEDVYDTVYDKVTVELDKVTIDFDKVSIDFAHYRKGFWAYIYTYINTHIHTYLWPSCFRLRAFEWSSTCHSAAPPASERDATHKYTHTHSLSLTHTHTCIQTGTHTHTHRESARAREKDTYSVYEAQVGFNLKP
jgi:hypothetical protein